MSKKEELYVRKIKNGTVIDHIAAGLSLEVLKILKINRRGEDVVSVAMNVPSKKYGKKDVVKIENRELKPEEVDRIALIAPKATINIIRDYEVFEKKKVKLPDTIKGILKCNNPSCISNMREPIEPTFNVEHMEPVRLRCHYCNRFMEREDILQQF